MDDEARRGANTIVAGVASATPGPPAHYPSPPPSPPATHSLSNHHEHSRPSTPTPAPMPRPTIRTTTHALTVDSILATPTTLNALPHHTRRELIALLEASSKRDLVGSMPVEVGLKILSSLLPPPHLASRYELDEGIRSLVRASAVSSTWRRLARDPSLWRGASEDARMSSWLLESRRSREGLEHIPFYRHAHSLQKTWAKRKGGRLEGVYYSPDPASVTSLHLLDRINPSNPTITNSTTPTIVLTLTNPSNPQSGRIHIISYERTAGSPNPRIRSISSGGAVWASAISRPPSGKGPAKLVTGGCEKILRVWDLETGRCLSMLHGHRSTIRCVGTFIGPPRFKKNTNPPPPASTSENGGGSKMTEYAISGSRDHTLRVWDIGRGVFVRILTGHTDSVRCLDVHASGEDDEQRIRVVSGSYDCSVRVWNPLAPQPLLHTLLGHTHQIYAVQFNPTGEWIASGSLEGCVRVWGVRSGQCRAILAGHTALVSNIQWTRDLLVTGGTDGRVVMFHTATSVGNVPSASLTSGSRSRPPTPMSDSGDNNDRSEASAPEPEITITHVQMLSAHYHSVSALLLKDGFPFGVSGSDDGRVRIFSVPAFPSSSNASSTPSSSSSSIPRSMEDSDSEVDMTSDPSSTSSTEYESEVSQTLRHLERDLEQGTLKRTWATMSSSGATTSSTSTTVATVAGAPHTPGYAGNTSQAEIIPVGLRRFEQIFRVAISNGGETLVVAGRRSNRMALEVWKFDEDEESSAAAVALLRGTSSSSSGDSVSGSEGPKKKKSREYGRWELPGDDSAE